MTSMSTRCHRLLTLAALAALASPWAHAALSEADVATVVRSVDAMRAGPGKDPFRIETQVTSIKADGSIDKQRNFSVFLQPERKILIMSRSASEQGQKLLMMGDDFWLMLPGSQRPMRITATQKMVGDAATADIGTVRWADEYAAKDVGEEKCGEQACVRLELNALRKSSSYARIDLWVGKLRNEPLKADLYLQSGKLAKSARFVLDNPRAPTLVMETILSDELSELKETRIRYLSREARSVPGEWFNPQYLASNPAIN